MHFDAPHRARVVGAWSRDGPPRFPVGATVDLDGDTLVGKVLRSASPQRVDRYEELRGTLAETMRDHGYTAAVAAPVSVGGRVWGALAAAATADEPLPEGLERRLCDFADLVAQALANADAYEKLAASRARARGGGRRGAPAAGAQPPRRRPAATRRRRPRAEHGERQAGARPRRRAAGAHRRPRRPRARPRRAARAGAWHPPRRPDRARPGPGARRPGDARAGPGRDRGAARRAAPGQRGGGGVLRHLRGARERRQVRAGVARDGQRPPLGRPRRGERGRRRRGRRRPGRRLRAARPRGARRGAQRPARDRQPARAAAPSIQVEIPVGEA